MKKRFFATALASILVMASLSGCAGDRSGGATTAAPAEGETTAESTGEETYTWRMAHEEYNGDVQDVYCKEFAELLSEKSDGRIQLDIYPVGQIGDALAQCELLQNGGLEFAIISPGNTGTVVPENQLFSLHFLFPDDQDKLQQLLVESEALNTMMSEKYLEKNIQVLSYWTEGPMQWTANKPLNTPDAFQGVKFRTMQSPMIMASYEAYGANPTPMSYTEVYSGLQLKMIDGQENPYFGIYSPKFHEVLSHLTEANSNYFFTTTCVNPTFFAGLPEDIQNIVLETVEEMVPRSFEIQQEVNADRKQKMQDESDIEIVTITDEEREMFREKAQSAYDQYEEIVGADGAAILEKLTEEIAAIEAQ